MLLEIAPPLLGGPKITSNEVAQITKAKFSKVVYKWDRSYTSDIISLQY
jgi:hypothetical protein